MKKTMPIEPVHARCEGCDKGYRVPDPDRTYTCKQCGGTVRAGSPPEDPGGAANAADELESLQLTTRQEAARELKREYKWIVAVTWLYRLGAAAYAGVTLVAVLALKSTSVPLGPGIVVVVLSTLLTVLMLMGAIQILFQPLAWTVAIASMATLVSVVHALGPNPLGLALLWSSAWAALVWIAVVPTLRFQRLLARHKDLYILQRASQRTRRTLKHDSFKSLHERLMGVMRRARRHAWRVSVTASALICVASALGSTAVLAKLRPQDFSVALGEFQAAWNASNLAAVGRFFPAEVREQRSAWLAGTAAGHGWRDGLPQLAEGSRRQAAGLTWVDYELAGLTLSTGWILIERKWNLSEIELPVPPLEGVLERFLAAWSLSDPRKIAAFFPPEFVERNLGPIERTVRGRGWDTFPEILDTFVGDYTDGETTVTLSTEKGDVTTEWLFRTNGTWSLHSFKFPKR